MDQFVIDGDRLRGEAALVKRVPFLEQRLGDLLAQRRLSGCVELLDQLVVGLDRLAVTEELVQRGAFARSALLTCSRSGRLVALPNCWISWS